MSVEFVSSCAPRIVWPLFFYFNLMVIYLPILKIRYCIDYKDKLFYIRIIFTSLLRSVTTRRKYVNSRCLQGGGERCEPMLNIGLLSSIEPKLSDNIFEFGYLIGKPLRVDMQGMLNVQKWGISR